MSVYRGRAAGRLLVYCLRVIYLKMNIFYEKIIDIEWVLLYKGRVKCQYFLTIIIVNKWSIEKPT